MEWHYYGFDCLLFGFHSTNSIVPEKIYSLGNHTKGESKTRRKMAKQSRRINRRR